ncbi:MAG: hypothetical protein RLZZ262_1481 [Bacteroidota bacterium]|jgi:hypothetical protein
MLKTLSNPWRMAASLAVVVLMSACGKEQEEDPEPTPPNPKVVFSFAFNPNQARLDNFGNPSVVPAGHAAQSPDFNSISAHYIELAPTAFTALGNGVVLYNGAQTTAGGDAAIDFDQATIVNEGQVFKRINLSSIPAGTYEYIRVSLSYQNYNINYLASGFDLNGTLASFVGFNNYITDYTIGTETVEVNDDRLQGYWGFESWVLGTPYVYTGQTPPGATTVPNPISSTSPIPAGSCVVTAQFDEPLVITGNETEDIQVVLSLSTNNSFEWMDTNPDGKFEPATENVVDMGIRGLIPIIY